MKFPNFGVMIARGDLAAECGFEGLAELQDDILRLCEAAHAPAVWATGVLESLARRGHPARAEITDAAAAQRAECVMLGKGPYITRALKTLDGILHRMQGREYKQQRLLGRLSIGAEQASGNLSTSP
jgi:pyruvate kinase